MSKQINEVHDSLPYSRFYTGWFVFYLFSFSFVCEELKSPLLKLRDEKIKHQQYISLSVCVMCIFPFKSSYLNL